MPAHASKTLEDVILILNGLSQAMNPASLFLLAGRVRTSRARVYCCAVLSRYIETETPILLVA